MPSPSLTPLRFIDAEIEVEFDQTPTLSKRPGVPSRFIWEGERFEVSTLISQWRDYARRGRMAKNMKAERLATASRRGSWGVGRFYFRVQTAAERYFDLYYDRAPQGAGDRQGHWFLWRELTAQGGQQ